MRGRIYIKLPVPWACPVLSCPLYFSHPLLAASNSDILLFISIIESYNISGHNPLRSTNTLNWGSSAERKAAKLFFPPLGKVFDLITAIPSVRIGWLCCYSKWLPTSQWLKITKVLFFVYTACPSWVMQGTLCGPQPRTQMEQPPSGTLLIVVAEGKRALKGSPCTTN